MPSNSGDPPLDRRRLDPETRRGSILAAAGRAFARAPYERVAMSDVAVEAGVSEGLVFRYFESKAALFTELVQTAVDELESRQLAAVDALPVRAPARDRVRAAIEVLLDHVAGHPEAWAAPLLGGGYPAPALEVRQAARRRATDRLRGYLAAPGWVRHEYALMAFPATVEGACLAWVERGCPAGERGALVEAVLGALEGSLGDWGR